MLAIFLLLLLQEPAPAPKPTAEPPYEKVEPTSLDVQAAVKFAFSEQKKKTKEPLALAGILTAEKAAIGPDNYRVCMFADRGGVTERAQIVVSRDPKKKKWDLQMWSWGSCR